MKKKITKELTVEEFNALPRNKKKVLVAKDVLAQLKASEIIARKGTYFSKSINTELWDLPARENLEYIKGCTVCALGACMVSVTKFANQLTLGQLHRFEDKEESTDLLATVFTPEEMLIIETAFEGEGSYTSYRIGKNTFGAEIDEDMTIKADEFSNRYNDSEKRLKAIMKNIIANKGEFIL